MSEFPQTWYRPARYGEDLLEVLTVLGETAQMITVESEWNGKKNVRRQNKAGAKPSQREALESMLVDAQRSEQYEKDECSRKIQRRKDIERAIAELPSAPTSAGRVRE